VVGVRDLVVLRTYDLDRVRSIRAVDEEIVARQIQRQPFDLIEADVAGTDEREPARVGFRSRHKRRIADRRHVQGIARDADRIAAVHEHRNRDGGHVEGVTALQTRQVQLRQSRPLDGHAIDRHRSRHGGKRVRCARADGFQHIIPVARHGERRGKPYQVRGMDVEHVRSKPVNQLDAVKARVVERLPAADLHPVSVHRAAIHRPVVVGQVIIDYQSVLVSGG